MRIPAALLALVRAEAQVAYPLEACGVLAGKDEPSHVIPMTNALTHPRAYQFDPDEQLAVWRRLDEAGLDPLVVYHSHPHGRPFPSPRDIAEAQPGVLYLIVGSPDIGLPARLFHIEPDGVFEEPIT